MSKTCLKEQIRILTVGTEEGKMFLVPGTIAFHYCKCLVPDMEAGSYQDSLRHVMEAELELSPGDC